MVPEKMLNELNQKDNQGSAVKILQRSWARLSSVGASWLLLAGI